MVGGVVAAEAAGAADAADAGGGGGRRVGVPAARRRICLRPMMFV